MNQLQSHEMQKCETEHNGLMDTDQRSMPKKHPKFL